MKKLLKKLKFLLRNQVGWVAAYYLLVHGIPPIAGAGGGDDEDKASERQEDLTRQETARARQQADLILQQQQGLADKVREQFLASVAPNQLESGRISRLNQMEPEFANLLRDLAIGGRQAPDIVPYESTFQPEFELLMDRMRSQAAQRGIVGSGLELENMGRAGIDLAIKQAQQRQQNRMLNEQLAAGRRGEFGNFMGNQQTLEESRRAREVQGQQNASLIPANILQRGYDSSNAEVTRTRAQNFGLESGDVDYYRQKAGEKDQAFGNLIGSGVGLATSFIPGAGPMIAPFAASAASGAAGYPQSGQYGTPPFVPPAPSGAEMRSTYRYGSKRPSLTDQFYGGNW